MVNESQAIALGWATAEQLEQMKVLTYKVNDVLKALFAEGNMILVDFKLEFGVSMTVSYLVTNSLQTVAVYGTKTLRRNSTKTVSVKV